MNGDKDIKDIIFFVLLMILLIWLAYEFGPKYQYDYQLIIKEDWYYLYDKNRLVDSFSANRAEYLDSIVMKDIQ